MSAPQPSAPAGRASLLQTVKAVGASFFGVRASRDHERDMASLNPAVVIAVGIALAAVFVFVLLMVVRFAVGS
jgi:hypothetical protein